MEEAFQAQVAGAEGRAGKVPPRGKAQAEGHGCGLLANKVRHKDTTVAAAYMALWQVPEQQHKKQYLRAIPRESVFFF